MLIKETQMQITTYTREAVKDAANRVLMMQSKTAYEDGFDFVKEIYGLPEAVKKALFEVMLTRNFGVDFHILEMAYEELQNTGSIECGQEYADRFEMFLSGMEFTLNEVIKDLSHQLTYEAETLDWDYFLDTAIWAKSIANSVKEQSSNRAIE